MTDSQAIRNGRRVLGGITDACAGWLRFTGAKAPAVNRMATELKRVQHSALLRWSKLDKRAFDEATAWLIETEQIIVEHGEGSKFYLLMKMN
ncbi:hypothetical protein ACFSQE_00845 [Vogesella fluminis]